MEFVVYDNIHTYEKRNPQAKFYPETDLKVKQVVVTPWNGFWIETDFEKEIHNVDINAPYVHIHKGIKSLSEMQFDTDPYYINKHDVVYNPKTHCIEIYKPGSFPWPWRKPIFVKRIRDNYYGSELPLKKTKALGEWRYNYSDEVLNIILNYYGGTRSSKYTTN